jgi:hypothetical protein
MSCGAQFATGFTKVTTRVEERRFPVVDEERGLVTEHKVNPPFDQPFSFFIAELFKIVDGKINRIEALVTLVPYGMWTGWPKK